MKTASISNSDLLKKLIQSIYIVASRRTSSRFADDTILSSMEALEDKYDFFKGVKVEKQVGSNNERVIHIDKHMVEHITKERIGKAIESLIRMVYDELSDEAGLYFISEFREYSDKQIVRSLSNTGIDLDQIQLEQHHAYERRVQKKKMKEGERKDNQLGYNWDKVTSWQHEEGSKFCTLYDEDGKVLDRLNLDNIIQNYVQTLSGDDSVDPEKLEKKVRIFEIEYTLLRLMHQQDMNANTAINILKISIDELNHIIKKLSKMDMVQYVSENTLELTSSGAEYVESQERK
ncbi:hypothetical protein B6U98_05965 [Thermoplasmatales archaeon ex4572_165]|nr:MAG: hypothetical protein B6U98_05965 [Thermoplasmatales archaeon ex4572_165]RLF56847.1 MAG: hypothetical protein DRN27_08950 [Thermoplasmata archaeon]